MCLREFLCISGVAAFVLQVATSKGTGKTNEKEHASVYWARELKQQTMMKSLSSCRRSEGQRICVAPGVKHLCW